MEHFLAYRVLLDQWDREETANGGMPLRLKSFENTASIPFPKALPQYVDSVWGTLTLERDRLMQVTRVEVEDKTSIYPRGEAGSRPSFGHPLRPGNPRHTMRPLFSLPKKPLRPMRAVKNASFASGRMRGLGLASNNKAATRLSSAGSAEGSPKGKASSTCAIGEVSTVGV